jgi:hypothetical protein
MPFINYAKSAAAPVPANEEVEEGEEDVPSERRRTSEENDDE